MCFFSKGAKKWSHWHWPNVQGTHSFCQCDFNSLRPAFFTMTKVEDIIRLQSRTMRAWGKIPWADLKGCTAWYTQFLGRDWYELCASSIERRAFIVIEKCLLQPTNNSMLYIAHGVNSGEIIVKVSTSRCFERLMQFERRDIHTHSNCNEMDLSVMEFPIHFYCTSHIAVQEFTVCRLLRL
jgi:hypothetical protein